MEHIAPDLESVLVDLSGITLDQLVTSGNPVLEGSLRQVLTDLTDPHPTLSYATNC